MAKQDQDLRSVYERNSRVAELFAWLIIVGLAVDIAAVFILGRSWLEGALTIGADALIILGVWGELRFEGRARVAGDGIVAEANQQAREAEARANESAVQLARLKAPRVLTTAQALALRLELLPFSGQAVTVTASPRTFEAASLADQIARMLDMAGTEVRRQDHWATFDPGVAQGIAVGFIPGSDKSERLGIALARLLQAEGFDAEPHAAPHMGTATPDWVLVVVGEKS